METYLPLLVLALVACLLATALVMKMSMLSPLVIHLLVWCVSAVLLASGIVIYHLPLTMSSTLLLFGAILAFFVGSITAAASQRLPMGKYTTSYHLPRLVITFLSVGVIVYSVLVVHRGYEIIEQIGFRENFVVHLRQEHWRRLSEVERSPTSMLRLITRPAAIFFAIASPVMWSAASRKLRFIIGLSWLSIAVEETVQGGRFMLILTVGIAAYAWWISRQKNPSPPRGLGKRTLAIAVSVLIVATSMLVVPLLRDPSLKQDPSSAVSHGIEGELNPQLLVFTEKYGLPSSVIVTAVYFANPIATFTWFHEESEYAEIGAMGQYNFATFFFPFDAFRSEEPEWYEIRSSMAEERAADGLSSNPWATGIRDFIVDFGHVGGIAAFAAIGFLTQSAFQCARRSDRVTSIVLGAMAWIMAAMLPLQSILVVRSFLQAVSFVLILFLFDRWLVRSRSRIEGGI